MMNLFKKNDTKKDVMHEIQNIERKFEMYRIAIALLISMAIIVVIILLFADKPIEAISSLFLGPLSTIRRMGNVIELMIPLTFTGLAITLIFKTHRFNLSPEGAFYLGSMIAVMTGLYVPFSPLFKVITGLVLGALAGGILGVIPAIINHKFGASEIVVSLMENYIVIFFVQYLLNYIVRDVNAYGIQSYPMPEGVSLFQFIPGTRIHIGLFIVLAIVVISYLVIYRTKWGYMLRITGLNEKFARYSGIKVVKVIILTQFIGAAVAGLGGAVEMYGIYTIFQFSASPGYGWDGIIVATLARLNPAFVPLSALFIAYIRVGASVLNRTSSVPTEIMVFVQAIIILFIASKAFMRAQKEKKIIETTNKFQEGAN